MKNKMEDLRDHLFETLEALKHKDKPMEIARAKAIADVAGKLVETAKVEVEFLRVAGVKRGTGFLSLPEESTKPAGHAALPAPHGGRSYAAGRTPALPAGKQ